MLLRSVNRRNKLLKALLLVSFLPSLFFSVFSEGLHNHPLFPSLSDQASVSSSPTFSAISLHHEDDNDNCPACQWEMSSLAYGSLFDIPAAAAMVDELSSTVVADFQIAARFCSIRAPPLS